MSIPSVKAVDPSPHGYGAGVRPSPRPQVLRDQFIAWSRIAPARQLRHQLLATLGLTEEALRALDPARRQALELFVQQRLLGMIDRRDAPLGLIVDLQA